MSKRQDEWVVSELDKLDRLLAEGQISQNEFDFRRTRFMEAQAKPDQPWYLRLGIAVLALLIAFVIIRLLV